MLEIETWLKLSIKPEEIEQTPNNVLAEGRDVEEEAASLYEEMKQKLEHAGKDFTDVGNRQKYRHLKGIK